MTREGSPPPAGLEQSLGSEWRVCLLACWPRGIRGGSRSLGLRRLELKFDLFPSQCGWCGGGEPPFFLLWFLATTLSVCPSARVGHEHLTPPEFPDLGHPTPTSRRSGRQSWAAFGQIALRKQNL